jgi:GAF domain-containing protein
MNPKAKVQKNTWVGLITHPDIISGNLFASDKTITETAVDMMDIDQVSIWRMTVGHDEFVCMDRYNRVTKSHSTGETIPILKYPDYFTAIKTSDLIKSSNVKQDSQTRELNAILWTPLGVKAHLSLPVWVKGSLEGIVHFDQITDQRDWRASDIETAIRISNVVAQAALASTMKRMNYQLEMSEQMALRIAHGDTQTETLQSILDYAVTLLEGDSGMIYSCDPNRQEIRMKAVYAVPTKFTSEVISYNEGIAGLVARTGRPLHIDDFSLWTISDPIYQMSKLYETTVAYPINLGGEIVGVVQVNRQKKENPFDSADIEMLKLVSDHVAVVMEYHHTLRRSRSYDLIQRLITQTSSTTHLDTLAENAITMLNRDMATNAGLIQILDVQATTGMSLNASRILLNELQMENTRLTETMVTFDWQQKDNQRVKLAKAMLDVGIRSSVLTPIKVDNDVVGFIGVGSANPRHWSDDEINVVETTARQLGVASIRLVNVLVNTSLDEIRLRYNVVTGNLNHQQPINETLNNIGNGAVHIFQPNHSVIFLRTTSNRLSCSWSYGMSENYRKLVETHKSDKVSTFLFSSPRLVHFSDIRVSRNIPGINDLNLPEVVRSGAFCPLVYNGQVFSVIGLFFDHVHTFTTTEIRTMEAYANQAAVSLWNSSLFEQLEDNYQGIALMLAKAMDDRDTRMPEYSQKLSKWAQETARALGCSDDELKEIHLAALMHDIGKTVVPDTILKKTGILSKEEKSLLKRIPVEGERILRSIPDLSGVSGIIRNAREHYDGTGYPDGKQGEDIPLGSRILAVADAYGSIIDDRPYQKARTPDEAVKELEQERSKQFDPVIVDAFLSIQPQKVM